MDQLEEALRRRAKEEDKRESVAVVDQDVKVRGNYDDDEEDDDDDDNDDGDDDNVKVIMLLMDKEVSKSALDLTLPHCCIHLAVHRCETPRPLVPPIFDC